MQTHSHNIWWLRITTFSVAAMAAASTAYWGLKWTATTPAQPTTPVVFATTRQADPLLVARLLGGSQTGAAATQTMPINTAASRFKLTGVVADRANSGYALIAVDGQPAKPYQVGAQVADTLVLQSVAARSAVLAPRRDAPASLTLDLPQLTPPP